MNSPDVGRWVQSIDITDPNSAQEVLIIQIPAYQTEAEMIGFYEIPPLKDTVETLRQCGETFYGYYINEELCGVISFKIEDGIMDIHRLFVHPKHFREGIARILFNFIQSNVNGFEIIIVSTGSKNEPAKGFYQSNGFSIMEERKVADNLSLTFFKKRWTSQG